MGWDCTAVITGDDDYDCEVFYCGDPSAPELDTDPVARSWAWEKPLRRSWRTAWVVLGLLAALLAALLLGASRPALDFLLNENLFWLLWLCFLGVVMLRRLWYLRRMRRQLAAGLAPDPGNWRRDRRWQQTVVVLFLVCWMLPLVGGMLPL